MPRGPRLSRGRATRWFGLAGASNIQQARGVHYQARYQPDMECYACGRVGTRQFRVAQIIFAGRDLGNRIICANRGACYRRMQAGQIGVISEQELPDVRPKRGQASRRGS